MKIFTVRSTNNTFYKKVKVEKKHLWYDVKTKKMQTLIGGQLKFQYDPKTKSQKVSVADFKENKKFTRSSIWSIREWFDTFSDEYKLTMVDDTNSHISFALSKDANERDVEAVEDALYEERFNFELEDNDD